MSNNKDDELQMHDSEQQNTNEDNNNHVTITTEQEKQQQNETDSSHEEEDQTRSNNQQLKSTDDDDESQSNEHNTTTTMSTATTTSTTTTTTDNDDLYDHDDDSDTSNISSSSRKHDTTEYHVEKSVMRRVKLYFLGDNGKWDDQGTGHVSCDFIKEKEEMCLVMISETDNAKLLESVISQDDIYHLQGESLIVWNDAELSVDMALSFQESEGCQQVWDEIRTIQGREPDSKDIIAMQFDEARRENHHGMDEDDENVVPAELPDPELGNLATIFKMMQDCGGASLVKSVLEPTFLEKYFRVFDRAEEMEDVDSLRVLFIIFKLLISLDSQQVLRVLFDKENVIRLMGILEYDPSLPVQKANHRDYLQRVVVFKEVIPFADRSIVDKIHQTFQVQYLKDTVLPRVLDDATFAALNQLINSNNAAIVNAIKDDSEFLGNLFSLIRSNDTKPEELRDAIKFLQEYNLLLRSCVGIRSEVFLKLTSNGLLQVIESKLRSSDEIVRHICAELLTSLLASDPVLIRTYIADQEPVISENNGGSTLLESIIHGIVDEVELGIQDSLTDVLKNILDPGIMMDKKDVVLKMFYSERSMTLLMSPLMHPDQYSTSAKIHVLEIFSFTVQNHAYMSKRFITNNNILKKALWLLETETQKDLILAIIRFFRVCISLHDVFYNSYIIRHNLFDYIMKVWRQNADKYNLINSAIIHLFDFICKENVKRLIKYVVTNYRTDFEKVDYVETFQALISLQSENESSDAVVHEPKVIAELKSDQDESYFDESDEEQSNTTEAVGEQGTADSGMEIADEEAYFHSLAHGKGKKEEEEDDDFIAKEESNTDETKNHQNHPLVIQFNGKGSSPQKRSHQTLWDRNASECANEDDPSEKRRRLSPIESIPLVTGTVIDADKHES